MVDAALTIAVGSIAKVAVDIAGATSAWQLLAAGGVVSLVGAIGVFATIKILKEARRRYKAGEVNADGHMDISPA